jgi:hypothetical protein
LEDNRVGSILVRGLNQKTIERLKERARLTGRSLQLEAKALLERAAETLPCARHDGCPRRTACTTAPSRTPSEGQPRAGDTPRKATPRRVGAPGARGGGAGRAM